MQYCLLEHEWRDKNKNIDNKFQAKSNYKKLSLNFKIF